MLLEEFFGFGTDDANMTVFTPSLLLLRIKSLIVTRQTVPTMQRSPRIVHSGFSIGYLIWYIRDIV